MSLHYKKQCFQVENIVCNALIHTKWNKKQPRIVMAGKASDIIVKGDSATIIG